MPPTTTLPFGSTYVPRQMRIRLESTKVHTSSLWPIGFERSRRSKSRCVTTSMSPGDVPALPTSTRVTCTWTVVTRIVAGPVPASERLCNGPKARTPITAPATSKPILCFITSPSCSS